LLKELEAKLGSYYQDGTETGSAIRTRYATEILRRYKPGFMLFHIIAVDHAAHAHGPLSVEAKKAMEHEDAMIGEVVQAALANDPDTVVAIVSDHGQVPVTRAFNVNVALIEAGLIAIEPPVIGRPVKVRDAKVRVQAGASGAIYLTDLADAGTRAKVSEVLRRLAGDPANGIDRIVEGSDVEKLGGYPGAGFVIGMKPGTVLGSDYMGSRLVTYPTTRGTHGYLPEVSGMNASFFIKGTGIKAGQDLGVIDMVRIAPTLAQVLGVKLNDTAEPALAVFNGPLGSK
jgi:predicted AlkP superfamily pyrophosphatase or phosphodiesterase